MTTPLTQGLHTTTGEFVPFDSLPEREGARSAALSRHDLRFDSLTDEEADVDPEGFRAEVEEYLRDALGLKKRPQCNFAESGRIAQRAYWVFLAHATTPPMYAIMRWEAPFAELLCCEAGLGDKPLTPAQAAAIEHLADNPAPPLDVDGEDV